MSLEKELAKAGVEAADVKRLGRLIKRAGEASIPTVVRYIAGIGRKPYVGLGSYTKELVAALHDPRELTDWDRRVIDLWSHPDMRLKLELRDWIPKMIAKYPDEDIAGNILGLGSNLDPFESEYTFFPFALQRYTGKQLNSGGRWVVARARDSYAKLVKAFPHGPSSDFWLFLAVHAPEVYAKHQAKLVTPIRPDEIEAERKRLGLAGAEPDTKSETKANTKTKANAKAKGKGKANATRYAFDQYATSLVKEFTAELDDDLTDIRELWVYVAQSRTLPDLILVKTDEEHPYSAAAAPKALAEVDDGDDPVLDAINDGLDEPLAWGDYYELPTTILYYELVRVAQQLGKALEKRLAKGAKVGLMIEDESFAKPESFAKLAKTRLEKLPAATREQLIAACYDDPKAASWLVAK